MVYEAPSVIKSGEQIGIRLALFNNWDQTLEVWNNYLLWKRKILCEKYPVIFFTGTHFITFSIFLSK